MELYYLNKEAKEIICPQCYFENYCRDELKIIATECKNFALKLRPEDYREGEKNEQRG